MSNLTIKENKGPDLSLHGILKYGKLYHNPDYKTLREHELSVKSPEFARVCETSSGALSVDTGKFTGRSPADKYIVHHPDSSDKIWWKTPGRKSSDNKPITPQVWEDLRRITLKYLNNRDLYLMDCYSGANPDSRLKVRFITDVAWQAHFIKNMFIRPAVDELGSFQPDFVVLCASGTHNPRWKEHKLNSEVYVAFNLEEKMLCIGGTCYGGEMKKGVFSIMNFYLPLKDIASMHCSANIGKKGDTAIFFGLSGTGKTTLSADPERALIGDDEHGWDKEGIFNLEGGCYAKTIDLDPAKEPDIYRAIREDALLENVVVNKDGIIDYHDDSKTKNTRVSYPIYHIQNIVKPVSRGSHAKNVIFLTADAFGVLPPVSRLTPEQMEYHFISGYTAKVAGTELGIKEPVPSFSACFGAAFLMLDPTVYSRLICQKIAEHNASSWLVNTGWIGGPPGIGNRIEIRYTRNIIKAILTNQLDTVAYSEIPFFRLRIPEEVTGVPTEILNPRNLWVKPESWDEAAIQLASKFMENFKAYCENPHAEMIASMGGPASI